MVKEDKLLNEFFSGIARSRDGGDIKGFPATPTSVE